MKEVELYDIVCNQTNCLNNQHTYCMSDCDHITPNSENCFMKIIKLEKKGV